MSRLSGTRLRVLFAGGPARLDALARHRLAPLLERVLRSDLLTRLLGHPLSARAQRVGAQTLARVLDRFPALRELVKPPSDSASTSPTPSSTPAPSPANEREVYDALVNALGDPDWRLRAQAALDLGQIYQPGVEDLLHRALRDDSAEVAAAAATSLAAQGSSRAIAALREVLENRDGFFSQVTRAACVHGLARCIDLSDAESVLNVVQDVDAEVSIAAILAISERFPDLAVTRLFSVLADDTSYFLPLVRLAAANALTRLGALSEDNRQLLLHREGDGDVRRVLEAQATR